MGKPAVTACERAPSTNRTDVRVVARKALLQLLEPLVGFVLDAGLSTYELQVILREAAVRSVAAKQSKSAQRVNISGIAAITGIPRGQISKILKSTADISERMAERRQQTTSRILAIWHQEPKYRTPGGEPADLRIYGRGATFESLVRSHGRGIPTRAMLDELLRAGAAEVLPSGLIRVKALVAAESGVTPRAIKTFGDRAAQLLSTMLQNMRNPEQPQFVASISDTVVSAAMLPLFRKELSTKGTEFLANLQETLYRTPPMRRDRSGRTGDSRVSVTIFQHEVPRAGKVKAESPPKRRNFRRVPRPGRQDPGPR